MIASLRNVFFALVCVFALAAVVPMSGLAEDAARPTPQDSQAAPAPAEQPSTMTGCPGMPGGGCCGTCQNQGAKPQGDAAEQAAGGCPCQRARELQKQRQGS